MSEPRTFRTRQVGDPGGFVRTFGTVVDAGRGRLLFDSADALAHAHGAPPADCARGKVAAFARDERGGEGGCEARCFQLSDGGTEARIVGCVNAAAAAVSLCAGPGARGRFHMRLDLPGDHCVHVDARVRPHAPGPGAMVDLGFRGVPFAVQAESAVDGRSCAVCLGPLNDYLIVRPRPGETASGFPVGEAIRLWRRFGIGGGDPIRARVAVVEPRDSLELAEAGEPPRVKFFTCGGREHPSAPLTGLGVLALAAPRLEWLPLGKSGRVETPAGPMALPRVAGLADGTAAVVFPPVVVDLGPPA